MFVHLVAGLVNGLQRRTAKLELAAGFQADVGPVFLQTDDLAGLDHRCPSEPVAQPLQHRADRSRACVGQWQQRIPAIAEFLMLGADAPVFAGLAAVSQIFGQLGVVFDRSATGLRNGHDLAPAEAVFSTEG